MNSYPTNQGLPVGNMPQWQSGTQVSPEVVQAMLALQQNQAAQQQIARQQKQAEALRQYGQSGVEATRPSKNYVGAPNWAQALANVYAGYKGKRMQEEADAEGERLAQQRQAALMRYFQELSRDSNTRRAPAQEADPYDFA